MKTIYINGLKEIEDNYDSYLIDQFGVLHNGTHAYPGAIETLKHLVALGKKVIVVSNSGKRSSVNARRLLSMGIDQSCFHRIVTSGEVAYHYLTSKKLVSSNQTCFLISRDGDTSAVEGLALSLTQDAAEADLILISSSEADRYDESHYRSLLKKSAIKNTPCLCTNPDKTMLTDSGLRFGAGRIAEIYQDLGGEVKWIGKPYQLIYDHILDTNDNIPHHRILCIGDSIEHDIAGGSRKGLHTLLVRSGIIADFSLSQLNSEIDRYGVVPDYIAPQLRV